MNTGNPAPYHEIVGGSALRKNIPDVSTGRLSCGGPNGGILHNMSHNVYISPKLSRVQAEFMRQKTLPHEAESEHAKPKKHPFHSDAHAILSYHRPGNPAPSGEVERELHDLNGVKEVTINPLTDTVKVRYDPKIVTAEKIRSVLKRLLAR